jgi:hypothetical protein
VQSIRFRVRIHPHSFSHTLSAIPFQNYARQGVPCRCFDRGEDPTRVPFALNTSTHDCWRNTRRLLIGQPAPWLEPPLQKLGRVFWNPAITIPEAKTKAGEKQILSTHVLHESWGCIL